MTIRSLVQRRLPERIDLDHLPIALVAFVLEHQVVEVASGEEANARVAGGDDELEHVEEADVYHLFAVDLFDGRVVAVYLAPEGQVVLRVVHSADAVVQAHDQVLAERGVGQGCYVVFGTVPVHKFLCSEIEDSYEFVERPGSEHADAVLWVWLHACDDVTALDPSDHLQLLDTPQNHRFVQVRSQQMLRVLTKHGRTSFQAKSTTLGLSGIFMSKIILVDRKKDSDDLFLFPQ